MGVEVWPDGSKYEVFHISYTRACIHLARRMARENYNLQIIAYMKGISLTMRLVGMGNTPGMMVKLTLEIG
jgi:hypothetical protein